MSSSQRMSIQEVDAAARKSVFGLQKYVNMSSIDDRLIALIDIRASQINACAWCLDIHVAEAREAGVSQRQIDLIAAWHEAESLFSEREQAVLAFTEEVTLISEAGVRDETWDRMRSLFSDQEVVEVLMTIATINVWNRLNVATRTALKERPGSSK